MSYDPLILTHMLRTPKYHALYGQLIIALSQTSTPSDSNIQTLLIRWIALKDPRTEALQADYPYAVAHHKLTGHFAENFPAEAPSTSSGDALRT